MYLQFQPDSISSVHSNYTAGIQGPTWSLFKTPQVSQCPRFHGFDRFPVNCQSVVPKPRRFVPQPKPRSRDLIFSPIHESLLQRWALAFIFIASAVSPPPFNLTLASHLTSIFELTAATIYHWSHIAAARSFSSLAPRSPPFLIASAAQPPLFLLVHRCSTSFYLAVLLFVVLLQLC